MHAWPAGVKRRRRRACDVFLLPRIYEGVAEQLTPAGPSAQNIAGRASVLDGGGAMHVVTGRASSAALDDLVLARARAGEQEALERVFRQFEAPIYTLARRLTRTPHDAEDVMQETFLEVVRSIARFRGDGSFGGWIRKVAARKALMRLRQMGSRPHEDELSDDLVDASTTAPAPIAERLDLESALARLTVAARAVIWLHDVEGYSHDEIGALMGKTASFSKSQLARAHARLRSMLVPPGEEPCT
jgi:RNA polymerase sigma factor (sigma-70 family)